MKWLIIVNVVGACGNFFFLGSTGDMQHLFIGGGNLIVASLGTWLYA